MDLCGDIPLPTKSLIMGEKNEPSVKTESWPIVAKLGILLFSIQDVILDVILDVVVSLLLKLL
jgi:hypothetical protein